MNEERMKERRKPGNQEVKEEGTKIETERV